MALGLGLEDGEADGVGFVEGSTRAGDAEASTEGVGVVITGIVRIELPD